VPAAPFHVKTLVAGYRPLDLVGICDAGAVSHRGIDGLTKGLDWTAGLRMGTVGESGLLDSVDVEPGDLVAVPLLAGDLRSTDDGLPGFDRAILSPGYSVGSSMDNDTKRVSAAKELLGLPHVVMDVSGKLTRGSPRQVLPTRGGDWAECSTSPVSSPTSQILGGQTR